MASHFQPNVVSLLADAAIAKGKAVKLGTDFKHCAVVSATTDAAIGIATNAATAAGDVVEVALAGGGAKALLAGTVATGALLAGGAAGTLDDAATGDRVVAVAMQDGVAADLIDVMVQISKLP